MKAQAIALNYVDIQIFIMMENEIKHVITKNDSFEFADYTNNNNIDFSKTITILFVLSFSQGHGSAGYCCDK